MAEAPYQLVSLNDADRWKAALQDIPHAFGHTWENCYAMHLSSGLPTYLFVFEYGATKIVCPIAERVYNGHVDIVTPYGFSGFAGTQVSVEFKKHWESFVKEQNYVSGYIGLNPIFENTSSVFPADVFEYNTLYVIDLKKDIAELFGNLPGNGRRQVKNLEKERYQYSTDKVLVNNFFLENFHPFFETKGVAVLGNFKMETLSYLLNLENVFTLGILKQGTVEAVSVFAYTPYGADYLFNISLPVGRHHTTSLLWWAIKHLKEIDIPLLNLGGGATEGDSIARFKRRLNPNAFKLKCLKQVYNLEVYERLCIEKGVDPQERDKYFPAYRQG
jgi:hypothetical protein